MRGAAWDLARTVREHPREEEGLDMEGSSEDVVSGAERTTARLGRKGWFPKPWALKGFAISASVIMVLVVFSQNVGPASSSLGGGTEAYEEQARRLTVADRASR